MRRTISLLLVVALVALGVATWSSAPTDAVRSSGAPSEAEVAGTAPPVGRVPRTKGVAGEEATAEPVSVRVVRGTVRDADEHPIADADVVLLVAAPNRSEVNWRTIVDLEHPRRSGRTSADGTFEFAAAPRGELFVVARKAGFAPGSAQVSDGDSAAIVLSAGAARTFNVVDERGRPVAGAVIVRLGESSNADAATTDADGNARLVCEATPWLCVHAAGFASRSLLPGLDGVTAPFSVVLREGRPLAGVVVDGEGAPIAGARVVSSAGEGELALAVTSAATGAFAFEGLDALPGSSSWRVYAAVDGLVGETTQVVPGDLHARLVLRRPGTIRGVVVFSDGKPAVGADIVRPSRQIGADGRFELDELVPGPREVWAKLRSPIDSRLELSGYALVDVPEGGVVSDVRIVLGAPPDTSYLLVRTLDGDEPANAHVIAWAGGVDVGDSWYAEDAAKSDGAVLLKVRKPPGTPVDLGATLSPHLRKARRPPGSSGGAPTGPTEAIEPLDARTEKPVVTEAGPPFTPVELHLGPPGRLTLKLVDPEGRPIAFDANAIAANSACVDGAFVVSATDFFWAVIRVPGYAERSVQHEPPHAELQEEVVRLEPARRVVGRLVMEGGLPAASETEVRVFVDGDGRGLQDVDLTGLDASGRFEFTALRRGSAALVVCVGKSWRHLRSFEIGSEGTIDLGTIPLSAPAPARGQILDAAGNGVGGVRIDFLDFSTLSRADPVATRPDGTFDVTLPLDPPLRLRVQRAGFVTRFIDVTPDTPQPIRVVLSPAGSVRVRVLHAIDAGWGSVEVRVPGTKLAWEPHWAEGSLVTGNVYDDLPPGPVDVVLSMRNGELVKRVDVVAGQVVDVVFGE